MLVIKNGTLISMAGIYKEKYDVAVENGKIAKVEKEIVPGPEDTVIDAAGKLITPGFIEPHCHLGIIDADGQDGNEMTVDPSTRNCGPSMPLTSTAACLTGLWRPASPP